MWKIDNGSETGTTTASYADALDWKVEELAQKTMLLKMGLARSWWRRPLCWLVRLLNFTMTGNGIDWCYR